MVDKVRLGWSMLLLVLYSSSGGQGRFGMVDVILAQYSSSSGQGKVAMADTYVGAV